MNDDELVQRLRRTLHEQADAFRPRPGRLPTPDGAAADDDNLYRRDTGSEPRTAEYTLLPPTGPVPIFGRTSRRWPPLVALGAAVAAAAAVVAAVLVTSGRHPVTFKPLATQGTSAPAAPRPTMAPTIPPATAATVPATRPPSAPVPAGFAPASVTFVSPGDGWVLGRAGTSGSCAVLARTTDGGDHWSAVNAPSIAGSCGSGQPGTGLGLALRFADPRDGWIYTTSAGGAPSRLWSTHDGGATWTETTLPLPGATIASLEASGGYVQMVVYGTCTSGTTGCQGQAVEQILTSPVASDEWVPSPLQPPVGAGPVPSSQLTLWGTDGWLVGTDRTVVSGAELSGGTQWSAWTPPCSSAHGTGVLAAASANDLAAVCAEGVWGAPDPGLPANEDWLFRSSDAGATFSPVAVVPGHQPQSVTAAPGQPLTIVVADAQRGLLASFDGGATWIPEAPGLSAAAPGPGHDFTYVGFTSASQGVAISSGPIPALYMTRDGGHNWTPVSF